MTSPLIELVHKPFLKAKLPDFHVGDTVDVHCRIVEGEKTRIQIFSGVVIARCGSRIDESFLVRRIVANQGVERRFLLNSPNVIDVKTKRRGKIRRAKLYFLRSRIGKARKLRELRIHKKESPTPALASASA